MSSKLVTLLVARNHTSIYMQMHGKIELFIVLQGGLYVALLSTNMCVGVWFIIGL